MTSDLRVAFVARDPAGGRCVDLIRALETRVQSAGQFAPRLTRIFELTNILRNFHPDRDVWRNRFAFSSARWGRLSRDIARQLAEVEYDAVLQTYPVVFALPATDRYGIHTDNTMAVTQRRFPEWVDLTPSERQRALAAEQDAFRAARFLAVTSEQAARSAIEDYGCDRSAVHVVPSGTLLPIPAAFPVRPESTPDTVLFAATSFERKGGETLLDAWRIVETELPSARLQIVGPKGSPPSLLPATCEWLGPRSRADLPALYLGARVFVLPTRFESALPHVIREAMAHGLPVVASDVTGYAALFPDPDWLFPVGDAEQLAERLIALLSDRDLADAIGRHNYDEARRRFDWGVLADRLAELLQAAAA